MSNARLTEDQMARIARALAEPRRVWILEPWGARQGQVSCQTLMGKLPVTPEDAFLSSSSTQRWTWVPLGGKA